MNDNTTGLSNPMDFWKVQQRNELRKLSLEYALRTEGGSGGSVIKSTEIAVQDAQFIYEYLTKDLDK